LNKKAKLILRDGTEFEGNIFGFPNDTSGEVVFNTGMTGYPEALTDPSYAGQILVMTFPLIGNYGVPDFNNPKKNQSYFESPKIQVKGLIVSDLALDYSHWNAEYSLSDWLFSQQIPGIFGIDTRRLTMILREYGTMTGVINHTGLDVPVFDPGQINLLPGVSVDAPAESGEGSKRVLLIDCGCKNNIQNDLIANGVRVIRVPWDYDFSDMDVSGIVVSSGPGNPEVYTDVIKNIRKILERDLPILGICLGHQMLGLAAGGRTFKLKYGHRSQNQPVLDILTNRCYMTSQNHGYALDMSSLNKDWDEWFVNLNDGTNEGIRHKSKPIMSVQFHPEASPGPVDTKYIFNEFINSL